MLTFVVNHNCNENALKLKSAFTMYGPTILIDSGSDISQNDVSAFDVILPNVYYSGLMNAAHEHMQNVDPAAPIIFICSDVTISDVDCFIRATSDAFRNPRVMVWGPSSFGAEHNQMWPKNTGHARMVSFVEGFCFAARRKLFDAICPVELSVNSLGWGLDIQMGYLTVCEGGRSVVDDRVCVGHPLSTGYNKVSARKQYDDWLEQQSSAARFYQKLAPSTLFRDGPGAILLAVLLRTVGAR